MVESQLHKDLKEAVVRHLSQGERYWMEQVMGYIREGNLRVDVEYTRKHRTYLVECETRPNIKRLQAKGRLRRNIFYRNIYILFIPIWEYQKKDWAALRGSFDIVYAYDPKLDALVGVTDLRFMGWLRDIVLNQLIPVYKSNRFQWLIRSMCFVRNRLRLLLKGYIQCRLCRLGVETPWEFCPRDDCPLTYWPYLNEERAT